MVFENTTGSACACNICGRKVPAGELCDYCSDDDNGANENISSMTTTDEITVHSTTMHSSGNGAPSQSMSDNDNVNNSNNDSGTYASGLVQSMMSVDDNLNSGYSSTTPLFFSSSSR